MIRKHVLTHTHTHTHTQSRDSVGRGQHSSNQISGISTRTIHQSTTPCVLASSLGISSWTPLKPQHSNPNPNPLANQLWSIDFLTPPTHVLIPHRLPAFLESLMPLKNWCWIHARWWKSSLKYSIRFCGMFSNFKNRSLLHIALLKCPHVQIAFLKFTSCDNQALVGCIPIPAITAYLNLKSLKSVNHLIRCITMTDWIFKSLRQF